jgi:beta-carotene hydroxylase
MLKNKADIRTICFMVVITGLLALQWSLPFSWPLFLAANFMAVSVAVMAHNHNHTRMWRNDLLNKLSDYWITCFYGYPVFAWIPTHNTNHHKHNNRIPDYTITYRYSESNNLLTLLTYPTISGLFQQEPNRRFLREAYRKNKKRFAYYISQFAVLVAFTGGALLLDWKKALLFIVIPQQFALFSVLVFNYVQHVHADEESETNHSRNFVGPVLNFFLFNNGYHTVHHDMPGRHWSENKEAHALVAATIDPRLIEQSFAWYLARNYVIGLVVPAARTKSMRLERIAATGRSAVAVGGSAGVESVVEAAPAAG